LREDRKEEEDLPREDMKEEESLHNENSHSVAA
jgi:hypothetical protein